MDLSEKLIAVLRYIDFATRLVELVRSFVTSQPANTVKDSADLTITLQSLALTHVAKILSTNAGPDTGEAVTREMADLAQSIIERSTLA